MSDKRKKKEISQVMEITQIDNSCKVIIQKETQIGFDNWSIEQKIIYQMTRAIETIAGQTERPIHAINKVIRHLIIAVEEKEKEYLERLPNAKSDQCTLF